MKLEQSSKSKVNHILYQTFVSLESINARYWNLKDQCQKYEGSSAFLKMTKLRFLTTLEFFTLFYPLKQN